VELRIEPTAEDLTTALLFDEETDYAVHKYFEGYPDTALTISFWMKTDDAAYNGTVISYATRHETNATLIYNYQDFQIMLGQEASPATGISANDGQWHHIAVTWRSISGETILYKDGQPAWQGTVSVNDTLPQDGFLVFGQDQDNPGGGFQSYQAFQGLLDEVQLWKRALSLEEINANMNSLLTGAESGLVAWWSFNDAARTAPGTASDFAIGGGHHMQLLGAESVVDLTTPVAYRTFSDP
jgi:hypothetical protein